MPSSAEQEFDGPLEGDAHQVSDGTSSIDGDLMAGIPADARLESGVPDGQRSNSLDFIQMTGLTRPPAHSPAQDAPNPAEVRPEDDLNPTAPLSFYEKGVSDVDDGGSGDAGVLPDASLDVSLVAESSSDTLQSAPPASSAAAFEDILASLESGSEVQTPNADTAPEELPEERSASTDLLALVDALGVGASEPDASEPTSDVAPTEPPQEEAPSSLFDETGGAESAPVEEMTDDWDALLDSVSAEGPAESNVAEAATPASNPGSGTGALAEAEHLMQELGQIGSGEHQAPPSSEGPEPSLLPTYSVTHPAPVDLDADLAYDYGAAPTRRRSRRHSRAARRGRKLAKLLLGLIVVTAAAVAAYVYVVAPAVEQAEDLEAKASRLMSEAKYTEASQVFDRLASHRRTDPVGGPAAQFQAAYALTLGPPQSTDEMRECYAEALSKFEAFSEANPHHPKRTRALALMGRLHYERGEFDEAIAILRDRVSPEDDLHAALTIYRYLGRSYSMKADYEAAESAYLQAATLPGNYSVDDDYYALGDMYNTRASLAAEPTDQEAFEKTAADYWRRAVQVPGIEPGQKAILQERLEWLAHKNSTPADDSMTPGVASETVDMSPADEAVISPADGGQEPDPMDEFNSGVVGTGGDTVASPAPENSDVPPPAEAAVETE
jgi:tetratricopeptide (TPR) repeat protein